MMALVSVDMSKVGVFVRAAAAGDGKKTALPLSTSHDAVNQHISGKDY